jgi:hypothetical protein
VRGRRRKSPQGKRTGQRDDSSEARQRFSRRRSALSEKPIDEYHVVAL